MLLLRSTAANATNTVAENTCRLPDRRRQITRQGQSFQEICAHQVSRRILGRKCLLFVPLVGAATSIMSDPFKAGLFWGLEQLRDPRAGPHRAPTSPGNESFPLERPTTKTIIRSSDNHYYCEQIISAFQIQVQMTAMAASHKGVKKKTPRGIFAS